ncbi:MAG: Flp family type IVb pilin [Bacilli bacterium]|nr:Flp family type IVb pilin [Bacilli bacterium]
MKLNNKGQALVEYLLIVALIAVIIIGAFNTFGGYIKDSMTKTSCSIIGSEFIKGKKPGQGYCEGEEE